MANIIRLTDFLNRISFQTAENEIAHTNLRSQKFGLRLTETEAIQIVAAREEALRNLGRVELNMDAVRKLIAAFCDSPYINQADYATTICDLVEIFYHMKNVTNDEIGDEELIEIMKDLYNNQCCGSLELLAGRELENLVESLRERSNDLFINHENEVPE